MTPIIIRHEVWRARDRRWWQPRWCWWLGCGPVYGYRWTHRGAVKAMECRLHGHDCTQTAYAKSRRRYWARLRGLVAAWWRHTGLTWPLRLRRALRDREVIAHMRRLLSIDPTRGNCSVCGVEKPLTRAGRVWHHGDCPGGGELPARVEVLS